MGALLLVLFHLCPDVAGSCYAFRGVCEGREVAALLFPAWQMTQGWVRQLTGVSNMRIRCANG